MPDKEKQKETVREDNIISALKDNNCVTDNVASGNNVKCSVTDNQSQMKVLKCDFCEKLFHSDENLKQHSITCSKVNSPCEKCGKKSKTVKQYYNHLRTCSDTKFTCDICKKTFSRNDTLLKHARSHYPTISTFKCPLCSLSCNSEKELQLHTGKEHVTVK